MRRLRDADGLILNLAPFRGIEPEFETALEVGAAIALGLPRGGLWLFARQLMAPFGRVAHVRGVVRDADGAGVGYFGLPPNLPLACWAPVVETATEAQGAGGVLRREGAGRSSRRWWSFLVEANKSCIVHLSLPQ